MARDVVVLNALRYTLNRDPASGARAYSITEDRSQPGDPGGRDYRDFIPWGHDGNSRKVDGFLGPEYHDGTDGRWDNLDTLGPELATVTLSTYDSTLGHSAALLDSTLILDQGALDGAITASNADGDAVMRGVTGITYAYILRGMIPAKVRLSNMTLINSGKVFPAPATGAIVTRAQLDTTRQEVSVGFGPAAPYQSLAEGAVTLMADGWAENAASVTADAFGQATDRVLALDGRTVRGNVLTGTVTMQNPTYSTVATITNLPAFTFTGHALDGNISLIGTTIGPLVLNLQTAEFRPLISEIDPSTENSRNMGRWFTMGAVIPLRDGVRYSNGLQGQSWGIERFLGNASPVRGYPTGGDGSTKWYVQAVYDEVVGDTWLIAWRPRQAGDHHPYPFSPYVIGHLASQVSRFVDYVGYANGERTMPAWIFGRGINMGYFLDGRTTRFIDDTSYRYITSGKTYLAEEYFDGVLADIEAVEFMTASTTANRTVTPSLSIDGGSSYVSLTAQTTDGFHRVLAASAGAPLATLQGANRLKVRLDYASNVATAAPQVISKVRVYFRWRPLMVRRFSWTFDLQDEPDGRTAVDQQNALLALPGNVPVLVNEDQDNDSYYVRIEGVTPVQEVSADNSDEQAVANRGTSRKVTVSATEWLVA